MNSVDTELAKYGFKPEELTLDSIVGHFGFSPEYFAGSQMQPGDLVHVAMVGVISGASAFALKDILTKFHDGPSVDDSGTAKKIFGKIKDVLDHSNNPIDGPGFEAAKQMGANPIKWHRAMFGHDPLNMEGWAQYINAEGGTISGSFAYMKHLVADCFSSQGLPIPGHSYFRDELVKNFTSKQFSQYFTIKARDLAADALSSVYAAVTQKESTIGNRDYRKYQLAIANRLSSLAGIFATTGCINPVDVFLVGVHSARLFAFEMRVSHEIHCKIQVLYDEVQSLSKEPIYNYEEQYQLAKKIKIHREQLLFD